MERKTNGKPRSRTKLRREPVQITDSTVKSGRPRIPAETAASTSHPKSRPRATRQKRVSIGEALREFGFDEHKFAETFAAAGRGLNKPAGKSGGVDKAGLDYLKEWSRYLEPPRTLEREMNDRAVPFKLVHHVPRPVRDSAAKNKKISAQALE